MHIEGGRIFDSSLRKSMPLGMVKKTTDAKRAELEADVQKFLEEGKKIVEGPSLQLKPKRPHYAPQKEPAKPTQPQEVRTKGRSAIGWPESVRIKDQLFAANMTYKQLAEAAGVPRATLAHWFQKIQIPSNSWKGRIDDALKLLMMKNRK